MTPLDALLELLERVGACQGAAVLVSEEELNEWPAEAVRELKTQRLLAKASPATSVVCPGCEWQCTMPVDTVSDGRGKAASFVVCDKPVGINRVPVPAALLTQLRCSLDAVGAFVAQSLGLRSESQRKIGDGLWEIGLLTGKRRSRTLCLRANGLLELVAGNNALPIAELVRFGIDGYSVDSDAIRQLVDAATAGDARYTPSNARLEARKLETQALHKIWRKAYRTLKQRRPDLSDVDCSRQIAKLPIAKRRTAETIRKHMKR